MSPNSMPAWHTTDEDTSVPVKAKSATTKSTKSVPRTTLTLAPRSVGMPAVLGMTAVLLSIGWYMGLGETLLGSLVGADATTTITITAEGRFVPETIDLRPGQEVTIINANEEPQVVKAVGGRELFETQVLFDDPFTFTVADDAKGPYIYGSETLPASVTVTFTVVLPSEVTTSSSTTSSDSSADPIPIPFDTQDVRETQTSSSAAAVVTNHASGPATISLGTASSSLSSSAASSQRSTVATIPTNPYTVHATGADQTVANTQALAQANEQLHSGAPLAQYANYRPPVTSSTGPEHTTVLVLLASGFLFLVITRRFMACK